MDLRVLTLTLAMLVAYTNAADPVDPDALECHVCNGMHQNQCNDPFGHYAETGDLRAPDTFVKKCEDPAVRKESGIPEGVKATMCRKIYQDVRGDVRVIRSCAWEENPKKDDPRNSCYKTVMEEYNTYVCTCDNESLCNGASLTQVSALSFALLPVVVMGLFR